MSDLRRPCSNCPWRIDAPRGYWDPQHFIAIWQNCQDDGMHVMLCHKSTALPADARMLTCQGWARVMGFSSIGVRLAVFRGMLRPEEVEDRGGPQLFRGFEDMLVAQGIDIPARNRFGGVR